MCLIDVQKPQHCKIEHAKRCICNIVTIIQAENDGIVFLDEIDKICTRGGDHHGADASAEGVQRDLLPLIEGLLNHLVPSRILNLEVLIVLGPWRLPVFRVHHQHQVRQCGDRSHPLHRVWCLPFCEAVGHAG